MTIPLIQFIDVSKSFGASPVLKGLNLSIYTGETIVVIGKSGTGKSVLLKHIYRTGPAGFRSDTY